MSDKGTPFRTRPADPVRVQADCGHSFEVPRSEYGDGSVYCNACQEFMCYERCPTLRHEAVSVCVPDGAE